jgi:hypothetical protein
MGLLQHFIVPVPQHLPAKPLEAGGSRLINVVAVLPSIGFHNHPAFNAGEVRNERPNRDLSQEFESAEMAIS